MDEGYLENVKILIIDDIQIIRSMVREILRVLVVQLRHLSPMTFESKQ